MFVLDRATPILVRVDGRSIRWRSRADTVAELLGELGVTVGEHDLITLNGAPATPAAELEPGTEIAATLSAGGILEAEARAPGVSVDIQRAIAVTLVDDGEPSVYHTTLGTLEEVLVSAGIQLGPADLVTPAPGTPLSDGLLAEIRRARTVTLRMGDATTVLQTHAATLGEALEEAGLRLDGNARVDPDIDSAVFDGLVDRIVRVLGVSVFEREEVPFVTVFSRTPR